MKQWLVKVFGGKPSVTFEQIRKFNLAVAVVLGGQAIAVVLFSASFTVPVYASFLTTDNLQSKLQGQTIVAPGIHEVAHINLAYVVAAMLLVTAVAYVLQATVWRRRYEVWLKKRMQPLRWVVIAVATSLALCMIGLLAGVQQLESLKSIAVFMIIASLGLWQLDLQSTQRRISPVAWASLAITLLAALAPWLIVMLSILSSAVFGAAPASSMWWLLGTTFIGWTLFAISAHFHRFAVGKWANYLYAEAWATGLVVLIETALTWQIFGAVLKP